MTIDEASSTRAWGSVTWGEKTRVEGREGGREGRQRSAWDGNGDGDEDWGGELVGTEMERVGWHKVVVEWWRKGWERTGRAVR